MDNYSKKIAKQFFKHKLGAISLFVIALFCIVGVYAPFFASSKPLVVVYDGTVYFPLFRYLFYSGFYTKKIDIFFNLLMFTIPVFLWVFPRKVLLLATVLAQFGLFAYFGYFAMKDPGSNAELNKERFQAKTLTWNDELKYLNDYGKLNQILNFRNMYENDKHLQKYSTAHRPTLWQLEIENEQKLTNNDSIAYVKARRQWLEEQNKRISFIIMPLFRTYHWEDDAGGDTELNKHVPWWKLTRINRKDLMAALIFGIRISLVVGILSVALALCIGIPIGVWAGFYGGTIDILVCRLLEIWESMPTFFMLLLVVAMLQSKSIFLVIAVVGLFGWTGFSRYLRGEFFKQRNLPYVEACRALGFRNSTIMFSHILPNAIPPVITLLPFAIMAAISAEAGLSFLGLGEENSCSWGVLMDEGRTSFPAESYLLWPPAILLTILLVAIALVGDALRDSIDPKLA